jgi:hypothetical protein
MVAMAGAGDWDIAGSLRAIEKAKSRLLASVSEVYAGLLAPATHRDRADRLAEVILQAFLLGEHLGVPCDAVTAAARAKLKAAHLSREAPEARLEAVCQYFFREENERKEAGG